MADDLPPLRLAPSETAEELAQRCAPEPGQANLEPSLAPFRVGSVRFLDAVPLTRGLEAEVVFATPSELAAMLRRNELDAALVSVTETLLCDRYDILDGVAIASLGEVKSVFLAHRGPLDQAREVFCDPASLASVHLLRVLLAERGLQPDFKPLPSYDFAGLPDYTLLIGDNALHFSLAPRAHKIWDLGAAWHELTRLPFVYAVWALPRGLHNAALRRQLRGARQFGLDTLDSIIRSRTEYDYDFRKDYLGWHIHYHLATDEKRGLARFADLLRKHGLGPLYEPRYVL
jgi:chorismate dehydratase